jgi:tetratricopeptide (TPR) repeat protein
MLEIARDIQTPVLISTVASNYADWEPNRSSFCGSKADHNELERLTDNGRTKANNGEWEAAIASYEDAIAICPLFAEAHYALGRLRRVTGETEKAWASFQSAIDNDGMPLRANRRQNDFIRSLSSERGAYVVDAVHHLREKSASRLLGYELMIDAHHPNLIGYTEITKLFAEKIQEVFDVDRKIQNVTVETVIEQFDFDDQDLFDVLIFNGRWMTRIATWRYDPQERLARADYIFQQAAKINSNSYEVPLGRAIVAYLGSRPEEAERFLEEARNRSEAEVSEYLQVPWISKVVERAHRQSRPIS